MSIFDKVKEMVSGSDKPKHSDSKTESKAQDGIDTAADRAQDKTGGRFDDQIERGRDATKDRFDS